MRLPRDLSEAERCRRRARRDHRITRRTGSHIRLTCQAPTEHYVTIPRHDPLRIGTLAAILASVAQAHSLARDEIIQRRFE